jgi:serine/threonine protein kinase
MKFFRKIYISFLKLKISAHARKAGVSLQFFGLNIQETELKQILTENSLRFQNVELKNCVGWDWKSEPQPLLKSNLTIYADFVLTLAERCLLVFLPEVLLKQKRAYLENRFFCFFAIPGYQRNFSVKKKSLLETFLRSPRSIQFGTLGYHLFLIRPEANFQNTAPFFVPLLFDGQFECFVRTYQLQRIRYFWKSRIFQKPEPFVGELYLKSKEKYKDGSFGKSYFEYQGRFLSTTKDNYLLDYWGIGPIVGMEILKNLPSFLFPTDPNLSQSDVFIEELNPRDTRSLTEEKVRELMNSDDQVSIFSRSHQE